MAVVFDANSAASQHANAVVGTTGFTTTGGLVTVGSGANRVLVVAINFSLPTVASVAVTWDTGGTNQAMTQIIAGTQTLLGDAQLWGLVAPTAGLKDLKVTWVGTSDIIVNGTSFTGADQTGGATTFPHGTSASAASGGAPTLTITSAVGNATVATVTVDGTPSVTTQTSTYVDTTPTSESGAGSRGAGAATVVHTFGDSGGTGAWVEVGTDIKASGVAVADALDWRQKDPHFSLGVPVRALVQSLSTAYLHQGPTTQQTFPVPEKSQHAPPLFAWDQHSRYALAVSPQPFQGPTVQPKYEFFPEGPVPRYARQVEIARWREVLPYPHVDPGPTIQDTVPLSEKSGPTPYSLLRLLPLVNLAVRPPIDQGPTVQQTFPTPEKSSATLSTLWLTYTRYKPGLPPPVDQGPTVLSTDPVPWKSEPTLYTARLWVPRFALTVAPPIDQGAIIQPTTDWYRAENVPPWLLRQRWSPQGALFRPIDVAVVVVADVTLPPADRAGQPVWPRTLWPPPSPPVQLDGPTVQDTFPPAPMREPTPYQRWRLIPLYQPIPLPPIDQGPTVSTLEVPLVLADRAAAYALLQAARYAVIRPPQLDGPPPIPPPPGTSPRIILLVNTGHLGVLLHGLLYEDLDAEDDGDA